jgi:L-threonylcarbamoyladenylate synthase
VGIESTIVAFDSETPLLLRPGGIGAEAIAAVLGRMPVTGHAAAPRAPGSLASHYAPRTPATLVSKEQLRAELVQLGDRDENIAVLTHEVEIPEAFDGLWIRAPRDPAGYARALYANLRTLDAAGADAILIEDIPEARDWTAVRDRLLRATAGIDDDRD